LGRDIQTSDAQAPTMSDPPNQTRPAEQEAPAPPIAAQPEAATPDAEVQPEKLPAISNKLELDEALVHRRSLLTALLLMKENSR